MAKKGEISRDVSPSHKNESSKPALFQQNMCSFERIDSLYYFPISYSIGRLLRMMCVTNPSSSKTENLSRSIGNFEIALQQEIDDWRTQSFRKYLVDVKIAPQTN